MRTFLLLSLFLAALIAGTIWFVGHRPARPPENMSAKDASKTITRAVVKPEKVIDYGAIKADGNTAIAELMRERKATYGVEKSLDMIVKPDESIKVGDKTVQMKRILDQVRLRQGQILETDLATGAEKGEPREYGIHVVNKDDNIWDIHFKLLKDYYEHKGIHVAPLADEPDRKGRSSGVGKILKFSEHMVHIYNLREHKLDTGLNQIYPLTKIVVYNMSDIFALLDRIDYKDVHRIEFDGETLWLPAES